MSGKEKIKLPPAQLFREFRVRFLPGAVFMGALFAAISLWNATVVQPVLIGETQAQARVTTPKSDVLTNLVSRTKPMLKPCDPMTGIVVTKTENHLQ